MKINQRLIIVLLIGVFVVAFAFLYINYSKQSSARTLAQQDLSQANAALEKSTAEKNAAQQQLDQANNDIAQLQNQVTTNEDKLADTRSSFPASADSVDYSEIFFDIARRYSVSVTSIATDKTSSARTDSLTFNTSTFQISIKGNMTDVINYLYALSTEPPFDYAKIATLGISQNQETTTTTNADGTETDTTITYEQMDIQITMYTYGG